ncbi:hypothetical protein RCO28_30510 [Streptomyces sp. LHD-70]|uniref:hypothetical protein n=1 Tax=Streptomyces sp. LHD-70 TaxID=3072140 RepID=UPI00280F7FC2|nr:hypothetical protein [Streptomyces sp. LHD-70]MDQ8706772.1 hypothetical protein [Streptomyces sp. LHD-70]
MTQTTPEKPVVLPIGFNAWLLDCVPVPRCKVCAANWDQLQALKAKDKITEAARHASEIRSHASGQHTR